MISSMRPLLCVIPRSVVTGAILKDIIRHIYRTMVETSDARRGTGYTRVPFRKHTQKRTIFGMNQETEVT